MCWSELNDIAIEYEKLINAAGVLSQFIIGIGLVIVACKANSIANSNMERAKQAKEDRLYEISSDDRQIFRDVYEMITQALALVMRDGRVEAEALSLFWKARDRARLELPDTVASYAEMLRENANKAFAVNESYLYPKHRDGLPVGEKRSQKVEEHEEHINVLLDAKPYEVFAPYMKITHKDTA